MDCYSLLEPFALLAAICRIVFFSLCAKPSADLELVGLSLSLTTLAELSERLRKIPLGPVDLRSVQPIYSRNDENLGLGMIPAHNKKENVHPC